MSFLVASLKTDSSVQLLPLTETLRDLLKNSIAAFVIDKNSPAIVSTSLALKQLPCHISLVSMRRLTANCLQKQSPSGVGIVL